jgi:hypothetical protein
VKLIPPETPLTVTADVLVAVSIKVNSKFGDTVELVGRVLGIAVIV